jgi:hypothetical protein
MVLATAATASPVDVVADPAGHSDAGTFVFLLRPASFINSLPVLELQVARVLAAKLHRILALLGLVAVPSDGATCE